jgi:hypothetical protein
MRRAAVALITLFVPVLLVAQQPPRVEVFGGYSLIHGFSVTVNGWDSALTTNLNSWFGITADLSGHYRRNYSLILGNPPTVAPVDMHSHSFTLGPRLSYRRSRCTLFAHTLLGVLHSSAAVHVATPIPSTFSFSGNAFTTLLGGGIDIPIGHRLAIRPVQPEWLFFRANGANANEFRFSTGVVLRFGER